MKKHILVIFLFLMLTFSSEAQSFWDDLTISAQYAAAHHDKRLFFSKERLLREQPEKWGTWQYGLSIQKEWINWGDFSVRQGLGYALEHQTFERSVDHCFNKQKDCTYVIIYSNNYKIHQLQVPVELSIQVFFGLDVSLSILPLFDFRKFVKFKWAGSTGKTDFNFYSLEVNPGLRYQWRRLFIGMHYRSWQIKKVDRVIFAPSTAGFTKTPNPILSDTYEHYNPVKLWFSMGYRLGGDK